MKSKDLQKLVLFKYENGWENGDSASKIFNDLNGLVSYRTIRRWCTMIRERGSIDLSHPPGRPPIVRTKAMIRKIFQTRLFIEDSQKVFDISRTKNDGVKQKQKFPERVMVGVGYAQKV
ncbi:unnamed protein product [Rotaria magnacalcarata]|uniref:Uncharacterized protein n=1 Tax=Rotaria magnacalcarata TaxID=392030 RepID=A0A816G8N2_9BILA|nr:unnamed protein product [Rotaria magnacalcarata]